MEQLDRREFLARGAVLLAAPGSIMAAGCGDTRVPPLSPIFQNWIVTLHPAIERLHTDASWSSRLGAVVAPPGGVEVGDFLREAKAQTSSWDVYVGQTPFVDMTQLLDGDAIEPWDEYMPAAVLDDIQPRIRAEATLDGRLYSWPFLIDVVAQGWNAELVERAGLDPERPARTWDEYIRNARTIVRSGSAPYGCTFDARGWRSLVPIAHNLTADPYTHDGLFDLTHPATVDALEVMRRMVELSHPDVLESGPVLGSINANEAAFAAQTVAYSVTHANAHVRFASSWPDPARMRVAALPTGTGPAGSVYWTTGIALLRYGKRKREAAAYAEALTYDGSVWRQSMGTGRDAAGQLPPYGSLLDPSIPSQAWMAPWVSDVAAALRTAREIRPHLLGERQFTVARPFWEEYLRGSEPSPRRALSHAMAAVRAEARRVSG